MYRICSVMLLAALWFPFLHTDASAGEAAALSMEDVRAGILSSRSKLNQLWVSYKITYRDENLGLRIEDGRWVSRSDYQGEYTFCIKPLRVNTAVQAFCIRYRPFPDDKSAPLTFSEKSYSWNGTSSTTLTVPRDGSGMPQAVISEEKDTHQLISGLYKPVVITTLSTGTWNHAFAEGALKLTGSEVLQGHNCYIIEGDRDASSYRKHPYHARTWICPEEDFSVLKAESFRADGQIDRYWSYEVLEMKQVGAFWFPLRVHYLNGEEIEVTDIRVNDEVKDEDFVITFPKGTEVIDRIAGAASNVPSTPTTTSNPAR